MVDEIANNIESNFNQTSVNVPDHTVPFQDHTTTEIFNGALTMLQEQAIIPHGYGMRAEEWEEDGYPLYETIRMGRHATRELDIFLPDHIWRPRAELWVQGLYTMNRVLGMEENGMLHR